MKMLANYDLIQLSSSGKSNNNLNSDKRRQKGRPNSNAVKIQIDYASQDTSGGQYMAIPKNLMQQAEMADGPEEPKNKLSQKEHIFDMHKLVPELVVMEQKLQSQRSSLQGKRLKVGSMSAKKNSQKRKFGLKTSS